MVGNYFLKLHILISHVDIYAIILQGWGYLSTNDITGTKNKENEKTTVN